MDSIEKILAQICEEKKLKLTEQRKEIAKILVSSNDHPNIDQIYERCRKTDKSISIATVYRTIKMFEELGIAQRLGFSDDGKSRYEINPETHHDHLIDVDTGEVVEFFNQELEDLKKKIAQDLGFDLVDHKLELYGKRRG